MKTLSILALASLAFVLPAQQKKPLKPFTPPPMPPASPYPPPTPEQMRDTYELSVERLTITSKYPPSLKVSPIQKSRFLSLGKKDEETTIVAYIVFDGQNSYGAMIRSTATCMAVAERKHLLACTSSDGDSIAQDVLPKWAVWGPTPTSAAEKGK
jgi:hypothetical protein